MAASVASVMLDRVLGTIGILLIGAAAATAAPPSAPRWLPWAAGSLAIIGTAGVAFVLLTRRAAVFVDAALSRVAAPRVRLAGTRLLDAISQYRSAPGPLANSLGASIGVQLLRVVQAWLLGLALGISTGFLTYLAYIPLVLLVMLLPITINGIGTSQAAFVWLFGTAGVTRADAFALSVLFVALGIIGNLPGAVLFASGGMERGDPEATGALRLR
jgi:hypothetical protein